MASRELSILVTAKNMASKVLGQVKGDVRGLEGATKRASSNMGRNIGIGVAAVGAGLAVQVKAGVDSLVELERVENLTAAALKSTGNVAKQSAEGIRARSEAMENLTGVDDKAIQNAQNLLLTFTNVGEEAFEPTTQAALDLNAALGGDDESLQGVLLQVAKAVNDPVRGMTALRRSGVSFTEAQQDQVKEMVAANDLMGAQALILGELETQFGGAAEAANQGVGGAQKKFADAIEDMQMALAKGFLPVIEKASGKLQELVGDPAFLAGVESFGDAVAGGLDAAIDFGTSVDWGAVGNALSTAGTGARMAMDAFLGAPAWLQTAILTGWGLNKLTGGGLGSIVGALGGGLIKGVLGMNAGVVNAKAGVVNVVGGPGMAGPAGGLGGAAGGLRGAINGGGLIGGLATGVAVAAPALAGVAAFKSIELEQGIKDMNANLGTRLDALPRSNAVELDASIARVEGAIEVANRDFVTTSISNAAGLNQRLDAELTELQTAKAAIVAAQDRAATSGAAGFIGLSQKTLDVANAQRSEGALSRQVMHARMMEMAGTQRSEGALARTAMITSASRVQAEVAAKGAAQVSAQYEALSAVRATQTPLNTIAAKNFSPTINIAPPSVNVSVYEYQRAFNQVVAAERNYSSLSGGI